MDGKKTKTTIPIERVSEWAKRYLVDQTVATSDRIVGEMKSYSEEIDVPYDEIKSAVIQEKKKLMMKVESPPVVEGDAPIIPKSLQKPEFRFILLGYWMNFRNKKGEMRRIPGVKTKKQLEELKADGWVAMGKIPEESDWQNTNNYAYNHPKLIAHQQKGFNYGIATGYGDLGILDDDTPDQQLIKLFEKEIGQTFSVLTGSQGIHVYIRVPGLDKKIIFFNKDGTHCGELQWQTQQCVAVGSIHPLGIKYEVLKDLPILEVSIEKFKEVFKDYIIKKEKIMHERIHTEFNGERIQDIPITNIVSTVGLMDMGDGCYQGNHPKHGSTGGMNFRINTHDNTWFCFRCRGGGGPAELIGVMENVISCNAAGPSCFSKDQAQKVIELARSKYNLKIPENVGDSLRKNMEEWMSADEKAMLEKVFTMDSFTSDFFKQTFELSEDLAQNILSFLEERKVIQFNSEKACYFIPQSSIILKTKLVNENFRDLKEVVRSYQKEKKEEEVQKRKERKEEDKKERIADKEIQKMEKDLERMNIQDEKSKLRAEKKQEELKEKKVTVTAKGPIRGWDDLYEIDRYVIYPGEEEYIYEIHLGGKVIKMNGSEIGDFKVFILKFYYQFGIMLKKFKGVADVWADLTTFWYDNFREEITPDKTDYSSPLSVAEEEIKNYIETCTVSDDYIVKEGVVILRNDCIYVPVPIVDRLMKRREIKLTSRKLSYALKEYLAADSIPLKVENKSIRFMRFKPEKFELNTKNKLEIKKDLDIEPEPNNEPQVVISSATQMKMENENGISNSDLSE